MHIKSSNPSTQQQPRRGPVVTGRDRRGHRMPRVPVTDMGCACEAPRIMCETNGVGQLVQKCLRCGQSNSVERRSGTPATRKRRAMEIFFFAPLTS